MFSLPTTVTINATEYEVRSDFRTVLEIFIMLDDPDLSDADKTEALLQMFYVNRPPDVEAALQAFMEFIDPRSSAYPRRRAQRSGSSSERTNSGESELSCRHREARRFGACEDAIDWQQDFDLMVAPVNHILGFECRAADYLHWQTFLSAYLEIPPESVFARVLRIREKLRTAKKLEKHERTWYNKNRELIHLKPKYSKAEEEILDAWT